MAYALKNGDRIVIQSSWHEKDRVKQVPGTKWDPEAKVWSVPLTWAACKQLRGVFGADLNVDPSLNEWALDELKYRVTPSLELRELWQIPFDGVYPVENTALYDFQLIGRDWLVTAGDALLADEMGTGKTIQALAAMEQLTTSHSLPAVVISPNSVKANWAVEAESWFPGANTYLIRGSAAERVKLLKAAAADPLALVLVNFEAVRLLSRLAPYGSIRLARCRKCDPKNGLEKLTATQCEVHPKPLNEIPFKTVIVDEAHRVKDPKAKQTRAIWAVAHGKTVRRRWALTGTPIANNPADLWSVMHTISPSEYPSRTAFVDRYCLMAWNNFGGMDVIGVNPTTKSELFSFLDPRMRRMLKSIVTPQLPPKVRTTRYVHMSPKAAKAYKELDDQAFTVVDGEILIGANGLTNAARLMQLASAYVKVDEHGTVTLCDPSPKLDELEVVLDELGDEQAVIAAEHRQLIMLAAKRLTKLKIPYGLIVGGTSEYERAQAVANLNAGLIRCILMTVKAGGTGLNLQKARNLINLQRSWSMVDNVQTENRVHRIGSDVHESVNIIDIVAYETIEADQILTLHTKLERLDEITRDRAQMMASGAYDTYDIDTEEATIMSYNPLAGAL